MDSEAGRLDGLLGDLDRLLEGGTAGRGNVDCLVEDGVTVSGGGGYLFVVDGAETLAVLTLSDVDGAAVGLRAGTVDLDVGVVVFCVSAGAEGGRSAKMVSMLVCTNDRCCVGSALRCRVNSK